MIEAEFLLTLLHGATNAHLLHWTTKSYAEHQALGKFYEELTELADDLAEALIGKFDQDVTFPANYFSAAATAKQEVEELGEYVAEERKKLPQDSEIQNMIDEIAQLIDSTLFQLRLS
jgi:ubiquinone biosynthesis protein UbiJ